MLTLVGRIAAASRAAVRRTGGRAGGLSTRRSWSLCPTSEAGSFDRLAMMLPAFAQRGFGPALTSFAGMATVGFFEPLIVMLVAQFAIYLATEPAGDVETGLVDLVLARPIAAPLARHAIADRDGGRARSRSP